MARDFGRIYAAMLISVAPSALGRYLDSLTQRFALG
jgi:hypothetical protein